MRPHLPRIVFVSVLGLAAGGCGAGLPDPDFIAHPRILALDAVVEAPADPVLGTRAEAMPFESVRLTPHLADPDGPFDPQSIAALDPQWFACTLRPGQGVGGCLLDARPLAPAAIPACPAPDAVDPGALDPSDPSSFESPTPCRLTEGPPEAPTLPVFLDPLFLLGGDLEVAFVAGLGGAYDTDRCVADLLSEPGTPLSYDCLVGVRRLAIGPDSTLAALAESFGVPAPGPPPPDPPETPDFNPVLDAITVTVSGQGGPFEIASGELVEAPIGALLEVVVSVTPDSAQDYLIVVDDAGTPRYETRTERLTGDFSSTWGYIEFGDSQGLEHRNQWTLMQAEEQDPKLPGDVVHLFVVVRDDRTGATFVKIPVRLTGPGP